MDPIYTGTKHLKRVKTINPINMGLDSLKWIRTTGPLRLGSIRIGAKHLKWAKVVSTSTVVTLGLFYFMSVLISREEGTREKSLDHSIEFLRVKPNDHLETRKRKIPKKPPQPKPPPQVQKLKVAQADLSKPQLDMDIPKMDLSIGKGDGPFLGAGGGSSDSEVMPLVRIEPQFPRKAAMRGIEGWVQLQFDVTEAGTISNVQVTDSSPPRMFDSNARRALLKWKYKPKMVEGKPVARKGLRVQLDFKLEDEAQ